MSDVLLNLLNILVVSNKYNPNYVTKRNDYSLVFSDIHTIDRKLSENVYEIVIIDGTEQHDLPSILQKLTGNPNLNIFICGEVSDKEQLNKINKGVFFWDDKFENISLEKAIRLSKLKASKVRYEKENETLREKLEMQKIMLDELEQTNNNLISATWRERDMKKQLKDAMDEIEKSKSIIELQNKRISESINYARKIQLAINPTEDDLKARLPESFILYKPKDTISGDFPWFSARGEAVYIAAVDCTGHGVPGAMMSMIGNLLLNDIVHRSENPDPGSILDNLHQSVVQTLKQRTSSSNSTDGMDIALLQVMTEESKICFASAHRPLFIIRNKELIEFKGDKFPIGGTQYDKKRVPFTTTSFSYEKGDLALIFSDGLPDQIGGPDRRKFMTSRIADIAIKHAESTIGELELAYEKAIEEWMSHEKQVDDILLIGIKF
ncbi:MAG: SpoIIE family protein phosphatase [Bacteroidetes bacterium]|nr:SpoIIE family protein phosphatase [Bacteroidota bacterium]